MAPPTLVVGESTCSSNQAAHLGVRRTSGWPSADRVLRPRMHVPTTKAVRASQSTRARRKVRRVEPQAANRRLGSFFWTSAHG